MVLEVNMLPEQPPETVGLIADRRLLLSADQSRVVEENDVSGHFLLAAVGRTIPAKEVKRLGLSADEDGRVVQFAAEPEAKERSKPEDKQREKPANKAVKKPATKRRT